MGNGFIALLVALGASVWIYSKMMKQSGSNVKSSVIVAIGGAAVIFVVLLLVFGALFKSN